MKSLETQLATYAEYHRDPRNIQTHFIGVPMIMFAVVILLSRPAAVVAGILPMSPAVIAALAACIYYVLLDTRYGFAMALVLALMLAAGQWVAQQSTALWLACGAGLFLVGWVIQFVGHFYEGRKPAFVDDIIGLVIGPLFVLAELGFLMGLRNEVREAIEKRAGPVRRRVAGTLP